MMLFALMLCPFCFTMGAFVFSGLLDPMARDLGVSVSTVATLQSAFAIACALCGPLLAKFTSSLNRKHLLLSTLLVLTVSNLASAFALDYRTLFWLRALSGGLGALAFPLAVTLATQANTPELRARAVAAVYAGVPFSLIFGVPAGSLVGAEFGWAASFALTAAVCAFALGFVWVKVPGLGEVAQVSASTSPASISGEAKVYLLITFLTLTSMFCLVGLIGPTITTLTGFDGRGIAAMQLLAGVSGLIGLRFGARLESGRSPYSLTLLFGVMVASLGILVGPLYSGLAGSAGLGLMALSILLGPLAQFAIAAIVQTRLAVSAGSAATLVLSINSSMIYLGQGLGIAVGAYALDIAGRGAPPLSGTLLAALGIAVAVVLERSRVQNQQS
jgi:DHA1 family inner membrane transport protein